MNILLPKPFEDFVQAKVNTGTYASASEVISAGLKALAIQEQQQIEQKINLGLEQANANLGEAFNEVFADKLMVEVEQRIATK